jgi:hypothetical protein
VILVDELFDTTPFTRAGTPRCFQNTKSCHMFSDLGGKEGTQELIAFAKRIGLKPQWIQHRGTHREHFDLVATKRARAVELGAREITMRESADLLAGKMRPAAE